MKINEIIVENKGVIHPDAKASSAHLSTYPALNNNNSPYDAYRFGMALARSPADPKGDATAAIGSDFVMVDFSNVDAEIRHGAEKVMGVAGKSMNSSKSKERDDVQKVSPTNKPKKNKYGV